MTVPLDVAFGPWAAAAVATAALLLWTGLAKVRPSASVAPPEALAVLAGSRPRARLALRALGVGELFAACLVLAVPHVGGSMIATLGVAFLGYLGWARRVAPGSSCGCGNETTPIGWYSFLRAAGLVAGGGLVMLAGQPWWHVAVARPGPFTGALASCVGTALLMLPEMRRWWLWPLRRLRMRMFGHPLASSGEVPPPAAAAVEVVEASLAWRTVAPVVRSGLLDQWQVDGWRILRYAGRYGAARPVTVLFAVDAGAKLGEQGEPEVRVCVLDDETDQTLPLIAA